MFYSKLTYMKHCYNVSLKKQSINDLRKVVDELVRTHNLLRGNFLNLIFQVLQILKIILPRMAEGFREQRGGIFLVLGLKQQKTKEWC